jgi:hypothetical protein
MKIDFNVVRKKALNSFNKLIKELNAGICTDVDYSRVIVPVQDIQRDIDSLRDALIAIACTYEENDQDFQCVIKDDDEILTFNPDKL